MLAFGTNIFALKYYSFHGYVKILRSSSNQRLQNVQAELGYTLSGKDRLQKLSTLKLYMIVSFFSVLCWLFKTIQYLMQYKINKQEVFYIVTPVKNYSPKTSNKISLISIQSCILIGVKTISTMLVR